jgi:type I restriction enzyme S subunit
MSGTLPPGWASVCVRDLAREDEQPVLTGPFGTNIGREDFVADGCPVLTIGCLTGDGIRPEKALYVQPEKAAELDRYKLRAGDLLFSRMASVGRAGIVPPNLDGALFNYHIMRLRLAPKAVLPELFLAYVRGAPRVPQYLDEVNHGATRDGINTAQLLAMPVALPPINEQRRIVAKLESLQARSRRAREALDAVPPLLEKLRQSILAAAFRGDLTKDWRAKHPNPEPASSEPWIDDDSGLARMPEGWHWTRLARIIRRLDQGWSPKCDSERRTSANEWAVMKTTAVQPGRFDETENKRLPENLKPRPECELSKGDLLITRAGPRSRAGVSCRVDQVQPRLLACDKVYRFRIDERFALGEYVELLLNSPQLLESIETMKTGISESGVNLTREKFTSLMLPLPSLAEQAQIVERAAGTIRTCNEFHIQMEDSLERLAEMERAILARAFRGELVPQDPSDEPAEALLAPSAPTSEPPVLTKSKPRNRRSKAAE